MCVSRACHCNHENTEEKLACQVETKPMIYVWLWEIFIALVDEEKRDLTAFFFQIRKVKWYPMFVKMLQCRSVHLESLNVCVRSYRNELTNTKWSRDQESATARLERYKKGRFSSAYADCTSFSLNTFDHESQQQRQERPSFESNEQENTKKESCNQISSSTICLPSSHPFTNSRFSYASKQRFIITLCLRNVCNWNNSIVKLTQPH